MRISDWSSDVCSADLRLTGGEPRVRRGIDTLAMRIGALIGRGLDELTLTTNAMRLAEHAPMLVAAGVRRINVSLDTLDAQAFRHITRVGDLAVAQRGIDTARAAGLSVKINIDRKSPRLNSSH